MFSYYLIVFYHSEYNPSFFKVFFLLINSVLLFLLPPCLPVSCLVIILMCEAFSSLPALITCYTAHRCDISSRCLSCLFQFKRSHSSCKAKTLLHNPLIQYVMTVYRNIRGSVASDDQTLCFLAVFPQRCTHKQEPACEPKATRSMKLVHDSCKDKVNMD